MNILDFYNEDGTFFLFEESDNEMERLGKETIEQQLLEEFTMLSEEEQEQKMKLSVKACLNIINSKIDKFKKAEAKARTDEKFGKKLGKIAAKEAEKLGKLKDDPVKLARSVCSTTGILKTLGLFLTASVSYAGGYAVGDTIGKKIGNKGKSSTKLTGKSRKERAKELFDYKKDKLQKFGKLSNKDKLQTLKNKKMSPKTAGALGAGVGFAIGYNAGDALQRTIGSKDPRVQAAAKKYYAIVVMIAKKYNK